MVNAMGGGCLRSCFENLAWMQTWRPELLVGSAMGEGRLRNCF